MAGPTATTPVAWYRADAGTSTTTDGAAVSQWDDQSGNGRHLVQATGAAQPTFETLETNGLPIIRFDGTDDQLAYQNATEFITGTNLTLAVVCKLRTNAVNTFVTGLTNNEVGADWSSTTGMRLGQETSVGTGQIVAFRNSVPLTEQTNPANGTLMLHLIWFDGTNANHRYNLAAADTDAITPSTEAWSIGWLGVGAGWHASATNGPGAYDVAEWVLYDTDVGSTERTALENHLERWFVAPGLRRAFTPIPFMR